MTTLTPEAVDGLKVQELKEACKQLNLPQTGNKPELVARLKAALAAQPAAGQGEAAPAAQEPAPAPQEAAAEGSAPAAADETAAASDGARPKIVFSEATAAKFEAQKIQVVHVAAKPDEPKAMTAAEKLLLRKQRFKDPEADKLKNRAQRFNLIDADVEKDKMLKRAERFGVADPQLDEIKKQQRAARFGIVDDETKKKARVDKFKPLPATAAGALGTSADFEAKRKARVARFAAAT